jgi:hypothetical protein
MFTEEEKTMLRDACISKINELNQYKGKQFVDSKALDDYQEKLLEIMDKI